MTATKVHTLLDEHGVSYETHTHTRAVSAQRLAAEEEVSGWHIAKPVMLAVGEGDQLVMAVIPGAANLDLGKASQVLGGNEVRLAREEEFVGRFPDCEAGAEPPFGSLYGIPVFLDEQLRAQERMICRDGSHTETITLSVADFVRVVQPEIADLSTGPA